MNAELVVLAVGPAATIQDRGRSGWARYGVTASGPADRASHELATRLVGNHPDAPALELLLGGFRATLSDARWASLTGAPATVTIDGVPVHDPALFRIPAGAELAIGVPAVGLRSTLAIAGGLVVPLVLGPASTDTLAGLGPSPVAPGARLPLGEPSGEPRWDGGLDALSVMRIPTELATVHFHWGPRDALLTAEQRAAFTGAVWQVSGETDRVGARLSGPAIEGVSGELPSEGTVLGSIQLPPSGQPIVFLADRPVTGGYPVIGVVREADVGLVAQARPGTRLRFSAVAEAPL